MNEGQMKNAGYTPENLHHMSGQLLHELVKELHEAVVGLLWQIDETKKFDYGIWESHFDDTIPHEHAQRLHRLLMTKHPKEVLKLYPHGDYEEFEKWWDRCDVGRSLISPGRKVGDERT